MKYKTKFNSYKLLTAVICVLLLSGCNKFVKHDSENLAPFAKQTVSMIGSLEYSLNESDIIYLRNIHNYSGDENLYRRYFALENQVNNMLTALVVYSMKIVTIS